MAGGFFTTEPPGKPAFFWGGRLILVQTHVVQDSSVVLLTLNYKVRKGGRLILVQTHVVQESTVVFLTLNYKVKKGVEAEKLVEF